MTDRQLQPRYVAADDLRGLRAELRQARQSLLEAEAELAQAEVNAFRMHCRLLLDDLVERLQALQTEKQALLTRLQLLRQGRDLGMSLDAEDPFWQDTAEPELEAEAELLLPTALLQRHVARQGGRKAAVSRTGAPFSSRPGGNGR